MVRSFWQEFLLRYFRGDLTSEGEVLWQSLRKIAPSIAKEAQEKHRGYSNRRHGVLIAKEEVLQQSKHFFHSCIGALCS